MPTFVDSKDVEIFLKGKKLRDFTYTPEEGFVGYLAGDVRDIKIEGTFSFSDEEDIKFLSNYRDSPEIDMDTLIKLGRVVSLEPKVGETAESFIERLASVYHTPTPTGGCLDK